MAEDRTVLKISVHIKIETSQMIHFPLLEILWSFPGDIFLVNILEVFKMVANVTGTINAPNCILGLWVSIRNHSHVSDEIMLTSSPHPFWSYHLCTWAGSFVGTFTLWWVWNHSLNCPLVKLTLFCAYKPQVLEITSGPSTLPVASKITN